MAPRKIRTLQIASSGQGPFSFCVKDISGTVISTQLCKLTRSCTSSVYMYTYSMYVLISWFEPWELKILS